MDDDFPRLTAREVGEAGRKDAGQDPMRCAVTGHAPVPFARRFVRPQEAKPRPSGPSEYGERIGATGGQELLWRPVILPR